MLYILKWSNVSEDEFRVCILCKVWCQVRFELRNLWSVSDYKLFYLVRYSNSYLLDANNSYD